MAGGPLSPKFLVIAEHRLVRVGTSTLLLQHFDPCEVTAVSTVEEVDRAFDRSEPSNLVVLDLPTRSSEEALALVQQIRSRCGSQTMLVLLDDMNDGQVTHLRRIGADAVLLRDASAAMLVGTVIGLLSKPSFRSEGAPQFAGVVPRQNTAVAPEEAPHRPNPQAHALTLAPQSLQGLTGKQLEVLEHLARGEPTKRIAARLSICEGTVKLHLTRIYRALGVLNRCQAIVAAGELGIGGLAGAVAKARRAG